MTQSHTHKEDEALQVADSEIVGVIDRLRNASKITKSFVLGDTLDKAADLLESFAASRPVAGAFGKVDLRGVDGGDVDEWRHLIRFGGVPKDTVLIRAADAHLAVTPYEKRASTTKARGAS